MPLSDREAAKLGWGRIVYVSGLLNPTGTYKVEEPHFAIILDTAEKIEETGESKVVVISTNDQLDPTYLVPTPKTSGLSGNVVCSWRPVIHESQIIRLHNANLPPLDNIDLLPILEMIAKHHLDTKPKKKK